MNSNSNLSVLKGPNWPFPRVKYLSRLFEDNAAKYPDTPAVIYKDMISGIVRQLTFSELDKDANRMARTILNNFETSPNSDGDFVIAVSLPPSDALVLTLLAIWKCGASQLTLNKHTPSTTLQHILKETKPVLIVTEEDESERGAAYNGYKAVSFRRLIVEATKVSPLLIGDNEMLPSGSHPLAIILYTSGSTGIPKGVRLPHHVVNNRLRWQWREFPYSSTESVCVFKTTPIFVDAVSELWAPLLNPEPRSVLVLPKEVTVDPQRLISLLEEYENIKTWVCSGEPLPVSLAMQFFNHYSFDSYRLCNFYGSTEVMGDVTFHVMKNEGDVSVNAKVPIGKPLDNTVIYLLDKQLQPVPVGEMGEIFVSGLNVSAGYVNDREPERFIKNLHSVEPGHDRLYRTGDYGRIVEEVIIYEGRSDSQIKVRGHRVNLAEIEFALNRVKGVNNSAVLCYRQGEVEQVIIAYVTQHEDSNLTGEEIEKVLKSSLAPYAVPQVILIDKMPLLYNGKVDRQKLKNKYAELIEGKSNSENVEIDYSDVPEGKIDAAQCLLRTVATVLAGSLRGKISLQSNFYSLGGHSLNSVYTVTKLCEQGYFIDITDFITAETLLDVLKKLKHRDNEDENQRLTLENLRRQYKTEKIVEAYKPDVLRILVHSFYSKGLGRKYLEPRPQREDFEDLINNLWPAVVDNKFSFVVRSVESGKLIAASLNFDLHDAPPPFEFPERIRALADMLKNVQEPIIKNKLPQGKKKVLLGYTVGTDETLTAAENVAVVYYMENEVINLCRKLGFVGMFTTNSNPLTQQLAKDIFKYQILNDYQINTFVALDGSRPLRNAPDSARAISFYVEV